MRELAPLTLIVWGREDRFFPVAHAERAAQAIPNARLQVIPEAGHVSFLDQPQAFCKPWRTLSVRANLTMLQRHYRHNTE